MMPFGSLVSTAWTLGEFETVVDLWLTSGTLTEHAIDQPITFDAFAAGGGGDRATGDVGQSASGGGGGSARKTILRAAPSYTVTIGVGGATGTGGTAQAGGNTTIADAGGTVCQAIGGGRGISGNPTGTAGPGGTGGTGDSTKNGGNGVAASAITNFAGGAGAGSSTNAALAVPGDPEGAPSMSAAGASLDCAGGACRNAAAAIAGGKGRVIATYKRVIVPGYPYVAGASYNRDATNLTTRNVSIPGTFRTGDRLLVVVGVDGTSGTNSMTGYTELLDQNSATVSLGVYVRDADGADPVAFASASEQANWVVYRIRNAAPVANWDLTALAYSGAVPNPPSHTHPAGSKPMLWVVATSFESSTTNPALTAYPTGYGQRHSIIFRATSGGQSGLLACMRRTTAAAEDPGVFTMGARTGVVCTLAIPLVA